MHFVQVKAVSESKRQRDVFRFFPPCLRGQDIFAGSKDDHNLPPSHHLPTASTDHCLTALAQLGALRLKSSRAFISLIDGDTQHVLAEATPSLLLRSSLASRSIAAHALWVGNASFPRHRGICQEVLKLRPQPADVEPPLLFVGDLEADHRFEGKEWRKNGLKFRFYAGVPLISPDGAIIGTYGLFDEDPREELSRIEVEFLLDISATVMEQLSSHKLRRHQERGERMIRGLTRFVEGEGALQADAPNRSLLPIPALLQGGRKGSHTKSIVTPEPMEWDTPSIAIASRKGPNGQRRRQSDSPTGGVGWTASPQQSRTALLQEKTMPTDTKRMFSRAASIIREASELDGIVIFDASIASQSMDHLQRPRGNTDQKDSETTSDERPRHGTRTRRTASKHPTAMPGASSTESSSTRFSDSRDSSRPERMSQILGCSTTSGSSFSGHLSQLGDFSESELRKLLKAYPKGKILNFNRLTDQITSLESDSPHSDQVGPGVTNAKYQQCKKRERSTVLADAIQRLAPGAKSVAFLPLWDYERSRFFAGCLCWTTSADHPLSQEVDLVYLKAFGNSMMTELSRLDEIATSRMKNTFVASISHELRSPLHGILGGVEFMQETSLDAFQYSMLHSIRTCGRTLLDTLDHILDHANMNVFDSSVSRPAMTTGHSVKTIKDINSVSMLSKKPRTTRKRTAEMKSLVSCFDIALALEEVVESVFAGVSYRVLVRNKNDEDFGEGLAGASPTTSPKLTSEGGRKDIVLILDIPHRKNWYFNTLGGAWRRILMNLVGNAIKFTESGFVRISLRRDKPHHTTEAREALVTLSVVDSGIGMSPTYLADRLYTPFAKENLFSEGTGLGLSLVRQIVESLGGRIDLKSQVDIGTEVKLKLMLAQANDEPSRNEDHGILASVTERMKERRVCVLQPTLASDVMSARDRGTTQLVSSLTQTLFDWLNVEVVAMEEWVYSGADIVFCTEPSFQHLASIRQKAVPGHMAPITIFLASDAIEAAALRNDARMTSKESLVEIMTQPCGPHKLVRVLDDCLTRLASATANTCIPETPPYTPPEIQSSRDAAAYFTLPSRNSFPAQLPLPETQALNILITDDNAINRRLLTALMQKQHYTYSIATNGLEALNLYKESRSHSFKTTTLNSATSQTPAKFNAILMDLSMPIMDGITSTTHIRSFEKQHQLPRVPIIALTGLASASARLEAEGAGIDVFMSKPVRFGELIEVLDGL